MPYVSNIPILIFYKPPNQVIVHGKEIPKKKHHLY